MHRILALLNNFEQADKILKTAVEFAATHEIPLEILYVHEKPLFDLPDYFRNESTIGDDIMDKDKVKQEIQERLLKLDYQKDVAILVSVNDSEDKVWAQTKDASDTLVITAYHDKLTEKIAKKITAPVLVLKRETEAYNSIVLPIDLSKNTKSCIRLAKDIFDTQSIHLVYDYRYLVDVSLMDVDFLGVPVSEPLIDMQINDDIRKQQKESFELLKKEENVQGEFIEQTFSVEDDLKAYIEKKRFDLTLLCSQNNDFILSDSISFSLLEQLDTDILIYNQGEENEQ